MTKSLREQKIGETFVLSQVALYGLFPIVINYGAKIMPPILFLAMSTLTGTAVLFIYLLATRRFKDIFNKKAYKYIFGVIIFIAIIPKLLIILGTSLTSGTNTAILLQAEIIFTFLICSIFFHEKITLKRLIGATIVLSGATAVLYQGSFDINTGDLLIIAGTFFFPIGNIFAKKALQLTSAAAILFLRSIVAGLFLLMLSFAVEGTSGTFLFHANTNLFYILINGILIMALTKVLWYEGLRRIDISKAVAIGISSPAFSLLFAYMFLSEIPNAYQIFGVAAIIAGVLIITRKPFNKAKIVDL
jgi:O-acetylserine/cysteine efflux transporter